MPATKTRIDKVSTVVVTVADSDRALDFYVEKLGFEKRADEPFGGKYRWIEVAPEGADTTIALAPPPEGQAAGGTQTGITLQTGDIDSLRDELAGRGVDIDAEVSRMGAPVPPLCWFRDPDGNTLLLVEA